MKNDDSAKVKIPAIGLMATGILNVLFGIYFLLSAVVVGYSGLNYQGFSSEQEKFIFNIGFYGIIGLGVCGLLFAPVIILGALKMKNGSNLRLAKTSAVLAMLPITSFAFLIGIPFGIWALINLKKTEIKDLDKDLTANELAN